MAERALQARGCRGRRLAFEPLEERRVLATITVTSLADNLNVDGQVTLREAIRAAELNISVDGSTAGSAVSRDTIQFAPGLAGAINLSTVADSVVGPSALTITSNITIRGNANGITIQRDTEAGEMRLFRITATGNVIFENVSFTKGVASGATAAHGLGGAIYNTGTLEVIASTIYENSAHGGPASAPDPPGGGRGGAIYSLGGPVTIINSTFSSNSVHSGAGPTVTSSFGGAVYMLNGSLSVYNSTFVSNSATSGSGIYVLAEGGGAQASLVLHSSIVAQFAEPGSLIADMNVTEDQGGVTFTSGTHNIVHRALGFSGAYMSENALLGPLADNGGSVMTHALLIGSPALQQGANPLSLATDARGPGFARVQGSQPDIGAFELQTGLAPELIGDYNRDEVVNALDYVLWRIAVGSDVEENYEGADGSGDGEIDEQDYIAWRENYGRIPTGGAAASSSAGLNHVIQDQAIGALSALHGRGWPASLSRIERPMKSSLSGQRRPVVADETFDDAALLGVVAAVHRDSSGHASIRDEDCSREGCRALNDFAEVSQVRDELWTNWRKSDESFKSIRHANPEGSANTQSNTV